MFGNCCTNFIHNYYLLNYNTLKFKRFSTDIPTKAIEGTVLANKGCNGNLLNAPGVVREKAADLLKSLLVLRNAEGREEYDTRGLEIVDIDPRERMGFGYIVAQFDDSEETTAKAMKHLVGNNGVKIVVIGKKDTIKTNMTNKIAGIAKTLCMVPREIKHLGLKSFFQHSCDLLRGVI